MTSPQSPPSRCPRWSSLATCWEGPSQKSAGAKAGHSWALEEAAIESFPLVIHSPLVPADLQNFTKGQYVNPHASRACGSVKIFWLPLMYTPMRLTYTWRRGRVGDWKVAQDLWKDGLGKKRGRAANLFLIQTQTKWFQKEPYDSIGEPYLV